MPKKLKTGTVNLSDLNWKGYGNLQVAFHNGQILVDDLKKPGQVLVFTKEEWVAFLEGIRAGEFDL